MNGFVVIGMVVWTFFIACPLYERFREKNAGSRVPSRVGFGAVKRGHRLDKPVSGLKSRDNF
jgi:hypothetical protein